MYIGSSRPVHGFVNVNKYSHAIRALGATHIPISRVVLFHFGARRSDIPRPFPFPFCASCGDPRFLWVGWGAGVWGCGGVWWGAGTGEEAVKWWALNLVSTMRTAAASYHSQHYETSASISNASFDRGLAPTRFSTLLLTAAWAWNAWQSSYFAIERSRMRTAYM